MTQPSEALTDDQRVHRSFPLLTGGEDKALDALGICYTVLSELSEGTDIEAALRYLVARFSLNVRREISQ